MGPSRMCGNGSEIRRKHGTESGNLQKLRAKKTETNKDLSSMSIKKQ